MAEKLYNYLRDIIGFQIEGEELVKSFEKEYENFLERRLEDWRYPRLTQEEIIKIVSVVSEGYFIPVKANRELVIDKSYQEFLSSISRLIRLHQGKMRRLEIKSAAEEIIKRIKFGDMRKTFIWYLGGKFETIPIQTEENLIIEKGTFGIVENSAWGVFPSYFRIVWEGFSPESPGRVSLVPVVSFNQGAEYELEIFHNKQPKDFNLTFADQIKENRKW